MQDDRFEWDDEKAKSNWRKHRTTFEEARAVFEDPDRIDLLDDDPDEERWLAIGAVGAKCLAVVFTERNNRTRIISARKADKHEQADYFQARG